MENGSLQSLLKSFGPLSEPLLSSYVYQILQGLVYLHSNGVIHCDLKPANVLTTKDGYVCLTDFGVSKSILSSSTLTKTPDEALGSPHYMAPEVIQLQGVSEKSDIWSLGILVLELLTGNTPLGHLPAMNAMYKIVLDGPPEIPDGVLEELKDFLGKCLVKEEGKRATALELLSHPWLRDCAVSLFSFFEGFCGGSPSKLRETQGRLWARWCGFSRSYILSHIILLECPFPFY
jgi:serine/threonine protein kinase